MQANSDKYVFILVIAVILVWCFIRFKRWLYQPRTIELPFLDGTDEPVPSGEVVEFLESSDYEVLHGKHKVLIQMNVDDNEDTPMHSQMFIDYFVRKGNKVYIVKLAKERQPIKWSGSSIRDRLLPFYLLYEEIDGVLYVDVNLRKIKKITFRLDNRDRRNQ